MNLDWGVSSKDEAGFSGARFFFAWTGPRGHRQRRIFRKGIRVVRRPARVLSNTVPLPGQGLSPNRTLSGALESQKNPRDFIGFFKHIQTNYLQLFLKSWHAASNK